MGPSIASFSIPIIVIRIIHYKYNHHSIFLMRHRPTLLHENAFRWRFRKIYFLLKKNIFHFCFALGVFCLLFWQCDMRVFHSCSAVFSWPSLFCARQQTKHHDILVLYGDRLLKRQNVFRCFLYCQKNAFRIRTVKMFFVFWNPFLCHNKIVQFGKILSTANLSILAKLSIWWFNKVVHNIKATKLSRSVGNIPPVASFSGWQSIQK